MYTYIYIYTYMYVCVCVYIYIYIYIYIWNFEERFEVKISHDSADRRPGLCDFEPRCSWVPTTVVHYGYMALAWKRCLSGRMSVRECKIQLIQVMGRLSAVRVGCLGTEVHQRWTKWCQLWFRAPPTGRAALEALPAASRGPLQGLGWTRSEGKTGLLMAITNTNSDY